MPRKRDIEAAIAAYNSTNDRTVLLPPEAARLLAVMFSRGDVCRCSPADLEAQGFDRNVARKLLRALVHAGFLSQERGGQGFVATYRLHLPPQRQP